MSTSKLHTHSLPLPTRPVVVEIPREVGVAEPAPTQALVGAGAVNEAVNRRSSLDIGGVASRLRPGIMAGAMLASDAACLWLSWAGAVYGRWVFNGQYELSLYLRLWPLLPLFLLAYACARLYPPAPLSRPEELRKLTLVSSLLCLSLATATFFAREGYTYSRGVLALGWVLSLVLVPTGRSLVRLALAGRAWWGIPVVIIGDGPTAMGVLKTLLRQPEVGLKPVAVLARHHLRGRGVAEVHGVPVLGTVNQVKRLSKKYRIAYAVVSMSDLPEGHARRMLDAYAQTFHHLMVIPDLSGLSSLWVQAADLGGVLGLEVRHRLLDPWRKTLKRGLDLALIALFSPVLVPLVAVLALAVRIDSRGPVFYRHRRVGLCGRKFEAWKFRTMVPGADLNLESYLAEHPEALKEWLETQKLKHDPRVTRVGRWLRRTSLDELPQVWNVLKGDMSLVGPRPIVQDEVPKYGEHYGLYCQVRPGITGVWQTHGRNLLTYEERVGMDGYYVRNWSVWLDIWLLSRTVLPVILCRGAY